MEASNSLPFAKQKLPKNNSEENSSRNVCSIGIGQKSLLGGGTTKGSTMGSTTRTTTETTKGTTKESAHSVTINSLPIISTQQRPPPPFQFSESNSQGKTGLRLRRQSSSFTSAASASASASASYSASLASASLASASASASALAMSCAVPISILSNTQTSSSPTAQSTIDDQIPDSTTWASATISIKKRGGSSAANSATASSPFSANSSSVQPARRFTSGSIGPFGTGPTRSSFSASNPVAIASANPHYSSSHQNEAQSPAASFMAAFNTAATFSLGSYEEEDEYAVGDEIGDYTLIRQIGSGAFSKVFEAVTPIAPYFMTSSSTLIASNNQELTRGCGGRTNESLYSVAVKVVIKSGDDEESDTGTSGKINRTKDTELDYLKQIDRETAIWSRLHHPYILEMNEVIRLDDATIVISELAQGGTLLSHIQKTGRPGLPLHECKRIGYEIGLAISYLHLKMGIVHHDIKLENILLTSASKMTVKVADFGFATETGTQGHGSTCPGLCCSSTINTKEGKPTAPGSLHYLAPEHLLPPAPTLPDGNKGDVWAYGCVLYALVTGSLPFRESFLPRLQMDIVNARFDRGLLGAGNVEVVEGCLEREWRDRWDIGRCLKCTWFK